MTTPSPPRRMSPGTIRTSRWFAASLAIAVVATLLHLPWSLIGLPASVSAGVGAIVLLFSIRGVRSTGFVLLASIGLLLSGMLASNFVMQAVFYREYSALEQCQANAITVEATARCQTEFQNAVSERLRQWQSRLSPSSAPSSS